jgi:hypothetical protein
LFCASFVGHYNIFNVKTAASLFKKVIPDHFNLAILPEKILLEKSSDFPMGVVEEVLFQGALTEYIVTIEQQRIKVITPSNNSVNFVKGDAVSISALPENMISIYSSIEYV